MIKYALVLVLLAVGCGGETSVDGFEAASNLYREHFAGGRNAELLQHTVRRRGDFYMVSVPEGATGVSVPYLVHRTGVRNAAHPVKLAGEVVSSKAVSSKAVSSKAVSSKAVSSKAVSSKAVSSKALLDSLEAIVASFREVDAVAVLHHTGKGGATVYFTGQDILDFAGYEGDDRAAAFKSDLRQVAPGWSYYRADQPIDTP